MAELGAEMAIIADALQARPDWTPQQVRDRWAYDQRRIAASDGKLTEGVFFHALRCGQLAPARQTPQLDPAAYADRDGFVLGSDVSDQAGDESPHDRAARLVPASPTDRYAGQDFVWMQGQLYIQRWTDAQALAALAERRRRRPASGPGGAP